MSSGHCPDVRPYSSILVLASVGAISPSGECWIRQLLPEYAWHHLHHAVHRGYIVAVGIAAFVLMINRFYKNLLQDEGYVMMTLPVCVHQQIWSKLIVSTVWFAATVVVSSGCCIAAFDIRFVGELWQEMKNCCPRRDQTNHLDLVANGAAFAVELLILCIWVPFPSACGPCSAMAIGFSFPNHKKLFQHGRLYRNGHRSPNSGRPRYSSGERFLVPPASARLGAQRFRCGRYASGYVVSDCSGTYLLCRFSIS